MKPAPVGVPVYGRIPVVYSRLESLSGHGRPAVAVVVYGNRAYEDALLELQTLLTAKGFQVVAAAAFIGEHSFSSAELPIAANRPDHEDVAKAQSLGQAIAAKLEQGGYDDALQVPGNFPHKERSPSSRIVPETDRELCGHCGACVSACPTGAISPEVDPALTDASLHPLRRLYPELSFNCPLDYEPDHALVYPDASAKLPASSRAQNGICDAIVRATYDIHRQSLAAMVAQGPLPIPSNCSSSVPTPIDTRK